jgi:two-component system chemotaxis sensor kinase CheA
LLTSEEANRFDTSRILDILATPGFSTKKEVTDISGRGVGLDAVKSKLETIGGRLDLETQVGKGTNLL